MSTLMDPKLELQYYGQIHGRTYTYHVIIDGANPKYGYWMIHYVDQTITSPIQQIDRIIPLVQSDARNRFFLSIERYNFLIKAIRYLYGNIHLPMIFSYDETIDFSQLHNIKTQLVKWEKLHWGSLANTPLSDEKRLWVIKKLRAENHAMYDFETRALTRDNEVECHKIHTAMSLQIFELGQKYGDLCRKLENETEAAVSDRLYGLRYGKLYTHLITAIEYTSLKAQYDAVDNPDNCMDNQVASYYDDYLAKRIDEDNRRYEKEYDEIVAEEKQMKANMQDILAAKKYEMDEHNAYVIKLSESAKDTMRQMNASAMTQVNLKIKELNTIIDWIANKEDMMLKLYPVMRDLKGAALCLMYLMKN